MVVIIPHRVFPGVDMNPIYLTEEQSQAIACSSEQPLSAIDPRTNTAYVLVSVDVYERARALLEQSSPASVLEPRAPIAPMMLRSQKAFWRDLPELLKLKSKERQWIAYHGEERVGFGKTQTELYQTCFQRGIQRGEFYVGKIEADETSPWGTLEAEWSLYEHRDGEEKNVSPDSV